VAEEAADPFIEFGADDVFEFAGLAVSFVVVDAEGILEEALGETMAADDVAGAAFAAVGEFDVTVGFDMNESEVFHAGQRADGIDTTGGADVFYVGAIPFFAANPNLFEEMVEVDAVVHGDTLIDSEMTVNELDAAVSLLRDIGIVRDHEDGVAGTVEFAEQPDDDFFIGFVEIPGRLVGEDELGLIDERAGDGDALLFTTR
jgi:hypothetical protein